MKQFLTLVCLLFSATFAHAEILTCLFQHPAMVISYNGAQNQLAILELGQRPEDAALINSVQLYITGAGKMEVQSIEGKTILSLMQTDNAKLFLSDESFPFEAVYTYPFELSKSSKEDQLLMKSQTGVCESALLKKKNKI